MKVISVDKGDITNGSQTWKKYDIHQNTSSIKKSPFSYPLCIHRIHEMLNAEKVIFGGNIV
jgi:hypothetical protein